MIYIIFQLHFTLDPKPDACYARGSYPGTNIMKKKRSVLMPIGIPSKTTRNKHNFLKKTVLSFQIMSLNKQQREKFLNTNITHKYDLLHFLPTIGQPQLAGLYLKSFYNGIKRNRLQLPNSMISDDSKFCSYCGSVYIAGFNMKMRLREETTAHNQSTSKLCYECLHCGHTKEFLIEQKSEKEPIPAKSEFVAVWPTSDTTKMEASTAGFEVVRDKDKVKKKSSAKDRAKKRKMNSLSNMLSIKKQKEENKKSKLSLSLMDFMQK